MTLAAEQIEIDVDGTERSGVAWAAVIGGALAAAAVTLILMVLGSGLGLSAISPWAGVGASVATVAAGSIIWLVIVQWIASGFGGYLAGRLRSRASDAPDEVFFRDTANGFLAWALSTLIVAALVGSALSAIVGGGAQVAASVASGAAQGATQAGVSAAGSFDPTAYFVDTLYRPAASTGTTAAATTAPADTTTAAPTIGTTTPPAPVMNAGSSSDSNTVETRAETGRILANGLAASEFPAADIDYLASVVSARTGLTPDEAKARVTEVVQQMEAAKAKAQAVADEARKGAAHLALYMFLSLLVGAFIAATAAALGGKHRDEIPAR